MTALKLLVGIEVLIAVVIGYRGIYAPQQRQVHALTERRTTETQFRQSAEEVAALVQQIERYRARLPQAPDPSWLVQELLDQARTAQIELTSITKDSSQPIGAATRLGVTVRFEASYHHLGRFLEAIERSEKFLRVEHVQVGRADPRGGPVTITLTCSTLVIPPGLPGAGGGF